MKDFFSAKFLFEINRVLIEPIDKFFLGFGTAAVVIAIVFRVAQTLAPTPVDAKYRSKFFKLFLTIGLLEIVWYGARLQFVRFFGSHFVAILILLIGLVWFGRIAYGMAKNYKREKADFDKEQLRLKYLPK
jgi:H+/gluconate symporter-like permease